jgi:hypothetical protein
MYKSHVMGTQKCQKYFIQMCLKEVERTNIIYPLKCVFFSLNKKASPVQSFAVQRRAHVGSGRETYEDIRCVFEQTFRQAERNTRVYAHIHTHTQITTFPKKFKQIEKCR